MNKQQSLSNKAITLPVIFLVHFNIHSTNIRSPVNGSELFYTSTATFIPLSHFIS